MGIGEGFVKYVIFTPLTAVGAASMYVYGGVILTLFNTLNELFSGHFFNAFLEYFLLSALPPTSLSQILTQIVVGSLAAGLKWFLAMAMLGHKF